MNNQVPPVSGHVLCTVLASVPPFSPNKISGNSCKLTSAVASTSGPVVFASAIPGSSAPVQPTVVSDANVPGVASSSSLIAATSLLTTSCASSVVINIDSLNIAIVYPQWSLSILFCFSIKDFPFSFTNLIKFLPKSLDPFLCLLAPFMKKAYPLLFFFTWLKIDN